VTDDRSAALLIRVWLDGVDRFRARVIALGTDEPDDERTVALAASPGGVLDAIGHWLDDLPGHGPAVDPLARSEAPNLPPPERP
jgi:hypothetical protein